MCVYFVLRAHGCTCACMYDVYILLILVTVYCRPWLRCGSWCSVHSAQVCAA